MNNFSNKIPPSPHAPRPTPHTGEANWYAFYTAPRAEKKVAERLKENGTEHYLPLIKTLQQWSDRKKMVEKPLINSYIFVKTQQHLLIEVLNIHGISRYISFEGKPAAIPDYQIENLRLLVNSNENIEVSGERLSQGDSVEVTHGALRGLCGELIKFGSRNKVLVRLDKLDINFIIKIQKAFLKKSR